MDTHYIYKFLADYSNVDLVKRIFHLDYLVILRKNGSVYGFLGAVNPYGSNYKYHFPDYGGNESSGLLLRRGGNIYHVYVRERALTCLGEGFINNIGGAKSHVYANRTYVNVTYEAPYYDDCSFYTYINGEQADSEYLYPKESVTKNVNPVSTAREGSTFLVRVSSSKTFPYPDAIPNIVNTFSSTVLPSITAITAMHLPSKNTMPDGSDWHQSVWIYSADLSALRSRCSNLLMGGEGTTTYPKGGEIVTNLDRTGILSEGYYAIDNDTGFRLISENGGVIYRAFRPMGKTGTWVVSLRAVPSTSPSGNYRYRVNVVMSYTYSGTKPNYDPPSVSLRNFRIRASRYRGGSNDQLAAEWQSSNTISDTLSISASKTSDSSSYIYFNKGFSTVYIGLVSSGWTVVSNPSSLRISPETDTAI